MFFFGWIFSLGQSVKIVAPDDVAEKIKHIVAVEYKEKCCK